ncbi:hypothetical protein H6P81_019020 [Aristolochia fimbriata]|uniref:PROP1-like PPR domain-containing protein n=1 Tax=Aristolochia fimbriata TaxID=158543 RepID=A0AAV7E444_ARIFI|nr:hypothetical protein H6P81_019020 [Aristolochia fimbriata]
MLDLQSCCLRPCSTYLLVSDLGHPMLRNSTLLKIVSQYGLAKNMKLCNGFSYQVNSSIFCLFNYFCKIPESPELPSWFIFPSSEKSAVPNLNDNFVLPSLVKGGSNGAHDLKTCHTDVFSEILDCGVNEISELLKASCFESPEMVVHALDACNLDVSKTLVDKILKRFSNNWIPAFGFFNWANKQAGYNHSSDAYDSIIDILGKAEQFDLMWCLVDEMIQRKDFFSLITLSKIMRRLARTGRWKDAVDVFHRIEVFGLNQDTSAMNILLDALCKERNVEHARDVFLELRGRISPDANSFNILIHGWCKARKLVDAHLMMEEMRKYGFHPCVISYTSLIEAYSSDKNFRKVRLLLSEMHENGSPPNVVTYTIVMHALGKAKQTQEALEIFETMKKDGCSPDTSFFNSLIYILGKAGRLCDADDVFKQMSTSGIAPDVTTYNTLITSACDNSQEDKALVLLKKMEKSSCKPGLETYAPLLKMCCKKKRMKTLQFLLNDMFSKDISLELGTYTLLVRGLVCSGQLEHSCLFFEEMILKGFLPRKHTYNMLVKELERKNMEKARCKIQELMVQAENKHPLQAFNQTQANSFG